MNATAQESPKNALQLADGRYVLDPANDKHAWPALIAYATACKASDPVTADDLIANATIAIDATNHYVQVPETTLPGGHVEPAFMVGQYLCSKGPMGIVLINETDAPWTDVSFHEARDMCAAAGRPLITETQYLAMAFNASQQAANWVGGVVGEGKMKQGLRKGNVDEAQAGSYASDDADEDRWFVLSNGARICDLAGNADSWVFDNVQGDARGVVSKAFAEDSLSLTTAPYPSLQKGMGWRPGTGADGSGRALVRGGYWSDGDHAGVFILNLDSPDYRCGFVGFRCTK